MTRDLQPPLLAQVNPYLAERNIFKSLSPSEDFVASMDKFSDALSFLINLNNTEYDDPFKDFVEKLSVLYVIFCLSDDQFKKKLLKGILKKTVSKQDLENLLSKSNEKINTTDLPVELKLMYSHIPTLYKAGGKKSLFRFKNTWDVFVSIYAGVTSCRLSAEYLGETFGYSFLFSVASFLENWDSYKNKNIIDSKIQNFYLSVLAVLFLSFLSFGVLAFFYEEDWVGIVSCVSLGFFAVSAVLGRKYMNSSVEITFMGSSIQKELAKNLLDTLLTDWPNVKAFSMDSNLLENFLKFDRQQRNSIFLGKKKLNEFRLLMAEYDESYRNCNKDLSEYKTLLEKLLAKLEAVENYEAYISNTEEHINRLNKTIESIKIDSEKSHKLTELKKTLSDQVKEISFEGKKSEVEESARFLVEIHKILKSDLISTDNNLHRLSDECGKIFLADFKDNAVNVFQSSGQSAGFSYSEDEATDIQQTMSLHRVTSNLKGALRNCEDFIRDVDKQFVLSKTVEVDNTIETLASIKQDISEKIEEIELSIPDAVINKNAFFPQSSSSRLQRMEEDQIGEESFINGESSSSNFVSLP